MSDASYPAAAITEASLEFEFAGLDMTQRTKFFEQCIYGHEELAEATPIFRFTTTFGEETESQLPVESATEIVGYAARTSDASREVRILEDRLQVVRRDHYTDWETFVGWGSDWLGRFHDVADGVYLIGIVADYRNRLPAPDEQYEVSDWVRMAPQIPAALPQTLLSLSVSASIPFESGRADIEISTRDAVDRLFPELVLNIRTQLAGQLSLDSDDFADGLDRWLTALRKNKNTVFEACITEATRMRMRGA